MYLSQIKTSDIFYSFQEEHAKLQGQMGNKWIVYFLSNLKVKLMRGVHLIVMGMVIGAHIKLILMEITKLEVVITTVTNK